MNVYVGGANASGKSTILAALKRQDPTIEIVHGTTLLMNYLHIESGSYEAIRTIPQYELRLDYARAVRQLLDRPTHGTRILDSHYMIVRHGDVEHYAGDWIADFDGIVLTYADPATSWGRIKADESKRDRALSRPGLSDEEAFDEYAAYIHETKTFFHRLGARHRVPSLILDNSRITPQHSAAELAAFIRHLG